MKLTCNRFSKNKSGLNRRVEDMLARAAVTFGNGTDEYLEREALDKPPSGPPGESVLAADAWRLS
jgi:hypothetical protein